MTHKHFIYCFVKLPWASNSFLKKSLIFLLHKSSWLSHFLFPFDGGWGLGELVFTQPLDNSFFHSVSPSLEFTYICSIQWDPEPFFIVTQPNATVSPLHHHHHHHLLQENVTMYMGRRALRKYLLAEKPFANSEHILSTLRAHSEGTQRSHIEAHSRP